jgi:peptidoglycan/xylan/chitin deacetylase (PgdA/CDA1 family)
VRNGVSWTGPSKGRTLTDERAAAARSDLEAVRADRSQLVHRDIGQWFAGGWRLRMLRRAFVVLPAHLRQLLTLSVAGPAARSVAADLAFWHGVRALATAAEWESLTRSSYVGLLYHRIAGAHLPGQERMDVSPRRFRAQLRVLRLLRFRPLPVAELLAFHDGRRSTIGRRRYVLTVDDGFADAVEELRHHDHVPSIMFVPTHAVGMTAWWTDGGTVASRQALADVARNGVSLGSHTRRHRPLGGLASDELRDELDGSRDDLEALTPAPAPVLAYPYGQHDEAARERAVAVGFQACFTTTPGRNGIGTDPAQLRRVTPKQWDTIASFLFKALTGEPVPVRWERHLMRHVACRGERDERRHMAPCG